MDESDLKVGGLWVRLYRAVDKAVFLSRNRDVSRYLNNLIEQDHTCPLQELDPTIHLGFEGPGIH